MTTGPSFTIEAAQFRTLLSTVAPAVKAKSPLPILDGVQLTAAEDGTLTAWATDLEKGVLATAPAVVRAPGTIVVAHDLLRGLAARLAGPVACEPAKDALSVEAGSVRAKVRAYPDAEAMPIVPPTGEAVGMIDAQALVRAINRVQHAANELDTNTRQVLEGVYLCPRDGKLHAAATDGFVLAADVVERADVEAGTPGVITPVKGVRELAKLLKGTEGEVEYRMVKRGDIPDAITVVAPAFTFFCRLIDGTFPDYRRLIPDSTESVVTADAEELARAIKTARMFADIAEDKGIKRPQVRFAFEDNTVRVRTTDAAKGESDVSLGCRISGPGHARIVLSATYVLNVLEAVGEGAVEIGVTSPHHPVVFRNGDASFVVMPMIVGGN